MTNTITKITLDGNDYEVWTGNVVWPSSATDGHLAVFDWTTWKLIKDWWVVPSPTIVVDNLTTQSSTSALSANQGYVLNGNVNTKTFYLSSTSDLTTAQAAYDWYRAGKTPIIVLYNQTYVFSWKVSENISFIKAKTSITNNPNESYTQRVNEYLLFVVNSSYHVTMINETTGGEVRVLVTDRDYSTPYTPVYDWSPATKKYVDDKSTYVWSSAPSSPTEWMVWYDTTNDVLKTYDWSQWNSVWGGGGGGDVQVSTQANNILTTWMKIWAGTDANYANLWTYDNNTLYLTIE